LGSNQSSGTEASRIEAFSLNTGGNIAPVKTITQYQNDMPSPQTIAFDAAGNLYVANGPYPGLQGSTTFISIFAPGANGAAPPLRTIGAPQGSTLGNGVPEGISVDASGYVYLAETGYTSTGSADTIFVIAPNASGNVPPIRSITNSACPQIGGLTAMPSGKLIVTCVPSSTIEPYGANRRRAMQSQNPGEIEMFDAGASGNATPINVISGSDTQLSGAGSVALSPLGSIVVLPRAVRPGLVLTFPASGTGDVAPTTDIMGSNTQLTGSGAVTIDTNGNIYVINTQWGGNPPASITEFAPNANGNVAPINVISGSNTGVDIGWWGIAIGPP
jgi:hypothetical protein